MRSTRLPLPIFQPERWLELPATTLQKIYVLDSCGGKEFFWAQEPSGCCVVGLRAGERLLTQLIARVF